MFLDRKELRQALKAGYAAWQKGGDRWMAAGDTRWVRMEELLLIYDGKTLTEDTAAPSPSMMAVLTT